MELGMSAPIRYVGLDSETDAGRAVLLTTPTSHAMIDSWASCMAFLFSQSTNDFILYNMSYDFRAILAWCPRSIMKAIRRCGRSTYRGTGILLRGRKSASFTQGQRCIHLWDLYPFFESSLDTAAASYLHERKLGIPRTWYANMSARLADPTTRARVVKYGMRDADLTQRLWEIVEAQCVALGIQPWRAASPASIAKRAFPNPFAVLQKCAVRGNKLFQHSFYGGRTEIYMRGRVGACYRYDLHSAYPSILSTLPDPSGCDLARYDGKRPAAGRHVGYGTYHIAVSIPPDDPIPPLPFRAAGSSLVYPTGCFLTWTDATTLRLLREYGYRFHILYGLEYVYRERRRPLFPDIGRWYKIREENPALKLAAKKVLNSLYGKTAEQIRMRGVRARTVITSDMEYEDGEYFRALRVPSRHTCFAVAAACTAGCRAQVYRAMRQSPASIVSCHTDGIVSRVPLDLDIGPQMGQWGDEGRAAGAWVIGCGIGTYRYAGAYHDKVRGIPARSFGRRGLRAIFRAKTPRVEIAIQHARTLDESRRAGYCDLNIMEEICRVVDANMDDKRIWPFRWKSFREFATMRQRSVPLVVVQKKAVQVFLERSSPHGKE